MQGFGQNFVGLQRHVHPIHIRASRPGQGVRIQEPHMGCLLYTSLRNAARAAGAAALYSEHHFDGTPATNAMADTLVGMADAGACLLYTSVP